MSQMNIIQAVNSALHTMFERDSTVVSFGEDAGFYGGVFRCTSGLQEKFGKHRSFDTPLAEGGIMGIAVGMGMNGLRPVAEIQFADYIFPAYDQIVNEIAKVRHRSGGEFWCPLTIRTPAGGG
ncbi:MAG: alpha-ketoacid dehydrogenase subunit beta, partial [Candidatus Thalassarchaeaceae archaeon]|nr:alpha-ketoacid dehydrogenase subunit beta [Candidatus Thalassarchaeaceae archaeon]